MDGVIMPKLDGLFRVVKQLLGVDAAVVGKPQERTVDRYCVTGFP